MRASRGSDTNSGADADHAFQTISHAVSVVPDSYKIIVGPGVYSEAVSTDRAVGKPPKALSLIADPTGQQTKDARGDVVIDATNKAIGAGIRVSNSDHTLIDGFKITGGQDAGIVVKSGSSNLTVQNCIVHDNPGDGIRIQDSPNVLVFNNLVYANSGMGIGIVGSVSGSPGARVYSNTVFGNSDRGITVGTSKTASTGVAIHNNIVQDNGLRSTPNLENIKVFTNPNSLPVDEDYNLVFPATYLPDNLAGTHDLSADAVFVARGQDDFHLSKANPKSPAIDGGGPLNIADQWITILRQRTTTGTNLDSGVLDLGFHFLR